MISAYTWSSQLFGFSVTLLKETDRGAGSVTGIVNPEKYDDFTALAFYIQYINVYGFPGLANLSNRPEFVIRPLFSNLAI